MRESFGKNDCGRAGQLVGYLYGEAAAAERADFERHLRDCAACREELAAFTQVRTSVADFRAELLQTAPPVSLEQFATNADARPAAADDTHTPPRAESQSRTPPRAGSAPHPQLVGLASRADESRASASAAWAALREFFRLSPAWLRASTAAAALALVALAALALANAEITFGDERYAVRTGTRPAVAPDADAPATPPAQPEALTALQAQLSNVAAERDAAVRELEETRAELDDSRAANLVAAEFETGPAAQSVSPSPGGERSRRRAPSAAPSSSRGSRPRSEDEDLPRLLDLLGDAN